MEQEIQDLFLRNGGILRTRQLRENGIYYRKLQALMDAGEIEQVRRGYYQQTETQIFSDVPLLAAMFPDGIFCMETALWYYDYTERTPMEWHIAVDSKTSRKRFAIDYPPVRPHYLETSRLKLGANDGIIDDCHIHIYDRERTICDLLLHKNKVDTEIFNYAVRQYVNDINK
ncbi:MAG: type IV toxin-antitoxin system AbiEi family antitoxin domain-containing protein, partial [Clostridiales bacterium]|nr:type IV toxin-antitoxin system AbiEi family antitoxin domain-containing protein [Clostridiales bacterium]